MTLGSGRFGHVFRCTYEGERAAVKRIDRIKFHRNRRGRGHPVLTTPRRFRAISRGGSGGGRSTGFSGDLGAGRGFKEIQVLRRSQTTDGSSINGVLTTDGRLR